MPRLDSDNPGPQTATLVYVLAKCPKCNIDYAIIPDPSTPFFSQYLFFDRAQSLQNHTHICTGGLLCLRGHELDLIGQGVVLDEHWYMIPAFNDETARQN